MRINNVLLNFATSNTLSLITELYTCIKSPTLMCFTKFSLPFLAPLTPEVWYSASYVKHAVLSSPRGRFLLSVLYV